MATVQNQTNPLDFKSFDQGMLGSGVFAVPDPASDQRGAFKKVIITDITYDSCIIRGMFCIAFKWTPHQLDKTTIDCSTKGSPCVSSCADDKCLCIDGKCL
jgi:hypothetical protein